MTAAPSPLTPGAVTPQAPGRRSPASPVAGLRPSSPAPATTGPVAGAGSTPAPAAAGAAVGAGSSVIAKAMSEADWWPKPPLPEDIRFSAALDIEPMSKQRARVSPAEYTQVGATRVKTKSAHGYSPKSLKAYEERIGWLLRAAGVKRNDVDDLGVHAVFHVRGNQRRDLDNLVKALLDGCNGIAWRDDQQVTRLTSDLVRDSQQPRIDLVVYVVTSKERTCPKCGKSLSARQVTAQAVFCSKDCYDTSQRRGTYRTCVACGSSIYRQAGKALAEHTFCSAECRAAGRGVCRQCGQPNSKPWSGRRFCSPECSAAWHRERPLAKTSTPRGTCQDCGGPTSNVGALRCRGCWIAHSSANGQGSARRPTYDTCPDCGGRKRTTAARCMGCFHIAMRDGKAGLWKIDATNGTVARELAALAGFGGPP